MGILKTLFIILLLLFPLGQIARLEIQNGVAITLSDIAVGLVILVFIFSNKAKQSFNKSLIKPIILFAAIGLLSLIINIRDLSITEFIVSLSYGIRWLFYASIFFVVSSFDLSFKKVIIKLMIFIGSLVVIGGYFQYFLYPNLRNLYYLGWDEHLYRMFSSFLDPNFAGAFFVLYFLLLFGLTMDYIKYNKNNSLLLSLLSLITLVAVFLTYSRSALIMIIVGSICLFILKKQRKLIFIIVGIAIIFFIFAARNFYIENLNLLRTASSKARLESASYAISIIRDKPMLGVGFNAYRYAQERYGFIKEGNGSLSHSGAGTDNSFLFVLATTGVIGFIFYLFMWFKILISQGGNTMGYVVIASVVGLFVNAFFLNSLFYPSIMLWMWVLIGLSDYPDGDPSLRSG